MSTEKKAEDRLRDNGVFKGAYGLRGLLESREFWDDQPYGTRLYYGDGGGNYLHRDVLEAAVETLDGHDRIREKFTERNWQNKIIAETLGWTKVEQRSDKTLRGFEPDVRPWPGENCFKCPVDVPDFVAMLQPEPDEPEQTTQRLWEEDKPGVRYELHISESGFGHPYARRIDDVSEHELYDSSEEFYQLDDLVAFMQKARELDVSEGEIACLLGGMSAPDVPVGKWVATHGSSKEE